ncbi:TPA: DUF262 domain-containing protein [Pseudomonas aeruginosa]|uniref:DUF262 domain-containing protein n=1 Tax=Pseudomonas aeruginosa TaxID=287 RepID=UPI00071AFFB5|nr:DUF262 domain-containing protein [Pseudomonas aeruginosa]KSK28994.1 hypothetical protein APA27_05670 [Pseudomonas aeruginosa]KSM68889.1 hypothetical protein APA74_04855 [Pseudomonas aeruginosa]KSO64855.1 hypothetical protein APA97_04455 [Pseudomonas aeruginosa]MCT5581722.1 DUF262 domain-containing protein [Pseudomonas aeruginosa]MCV0242292.1 DUF262 domain-containing protein [Pseudomonas aeruginosa]
MKNFDTRAYNISDFLEWQQTGLLELSPKFQRRSVWTEKAKSYLVDTVLRGKPIPKILITQTLNAGRNIRTVVDGQQRLRAILGYVNGDFKVSRAHNKDYAGLVFDELPEDVKSEYLQYEIGVDMLFDLAFEDILDVFARLNTYSVKLNPQELLNAQYLGYFKQSAYALGFKYAAYWIEAGVLSEKDVMRMAEAELSSDLLGSLIEGIQPKKAIPNIYKKYDDNEEASLEAADRFDRVMAVVGAVYPSADLKETNYSRIHFFYTLFVSIAHCLFDLPHLEDVPRIVISGKNIGQVRNALDEISARYDEVTAKDALPPDDEYREFIEASRRATTDLSVRRSRTKFICQKLHEVV